MISGDLPHGDGNDPYVDGAYRWWHLSGPSPELVEAEADGWLGRPGTALDIGCGLGTEVSFLAAKGWDTVGIDLSPSALDQARKEHSHLQFIRASVLTLPFAIATFDLAIDRGCFHYMSISQRPDYAAEVHRVLRPGGQLLLRACLTSRGVRNDVSEPGISSAFQDWSIEHMSRAGIPSDTRVMQALVIRLRRP